MAKTNALGKDKKKTTRVSFQEIKQNTQAPADAAHGHAHTQPLCGQRRQGLGEEPAGDGVPSQPFTVIFSPALAKEKLPFLLVLFEQVGQGDPFRLNTSNFITVQQRAARAPQTGPQDPGDADFHGL